MKHQDHQNCKHKKVKFCEKCQNVFCLECKREWDYAPHSQITWIYLANPSIDAIGKKSDYSNVVNAPRVDIPITTCSHTGVGDVAI